MNSDTLTYFISERNAIVVLSLVGSITRDTVGLLPEIMEELRSRKAQMVVINSHDLIQVTKDTYDAFYKFQQFIRSFSTELKFCFLATHLKQELLGAECLNPTEITDNLMSALGNSLVMAKKAS